MEVAPLVLDDWVKQNKANFSPPICNKLLHKKQMTVMFVGGPNQREDFHIEGGSELFFQLKGNMELPIIEQGQRKLVEIKEGEMFLLPGRIPHSPQRPMEDSLGLVVERRREDNEFDGLRWYTDFTTCDEILWEKYFPCNDLGKDLVPVVEEFRRSEEAKSYKPTGSSVVSNPPLKQDMETRVQDPINVFQLIEQNRSKLGVSEGEGGEGGEGDRGDRGDQAVKGGGMVDHGREHGYDIFSSVDFLVRLEGGPQARTYEQLPGEVFLFQLEGPSIRIQTSPAGRNSGEVPLDSDNDSLHLHLRTESVKAGEVSVISAGSRLHVERPANSIGLVVFSTPPNSSSRNGNINPKASL